MKDANHIEPGGPSFPFGFQKIFWTKLIAIFLAARVSVL